MALTFADPKNFNATVQVAQSMYEHVARAGMSGMDFADVAAAIGIMNGMFLAGAYDKPLKQKIAAKNLMQAALAYAEQLQNAPRVPYDTLAAPLNAS